MPVLFWSPYAQWEDGVEEYIVGEMDKRGSWKKIGVTNGSVNQIKIDK